MTAKSTAAKALDKTLFADVVQEDLDALGKATRTEILKHAEKALNGKGKRRLAVEALQADGAKAATVLVVAMPNRPFIIDSLVAELSRQSLEPQLVAHPVIRADNGDETSLVAILLDGLDTGARKQLKADIGEVLDQVRVVTDDWKPMRERLSAAIEALRENPPSVPADALAETVQFIAWVLDNNFVLLGIREYDFDGEDAIAVEDSALGILRDPDLTIMTRGGEPVAMTGEIRDFLDRPDPLIITKANARARVHRNSHLDYIGLKRYDADGELKGELRIVGLFTSTAYNKSLSTIPVLRHKAASVLDHFDADPNSHAGKALTNVLETWPRDELFQIDTGLLTEFAGIAMRLEERPRIRVLARPDGFDRFVSVLVYVPRERYDTRVRERLGNYLAETFDGRLTAFYPAFLENGMVRVHFIIGRDTGETPAVERKTLEQRVTEITRTWEDRLRAADPDAQRHTFPLAYREAYDAATALHDAALFEDLTDDNSVAIDFHAARGDEAAHDAVKLKLFHLGEPLALSRRVPSLENMGFQVIDEVTYEIERQDGATIHIHDMSLRHVKGEAVDLERLDAPLTDMLNAVWRAQTGDDRFNGLVLMAGLDWQMASVMRAVAQYLRQIRTRFTARSMAETLARHPDITRDLADLFQARFDPSANDKKRDAAQDKLEAGITQALEEVSSSDDDRIIRNVRAVILAMLRTNFYAPREEGSEEAPAPVFAFKIDPARVPIMPKPVPYREIFVSAPQVEGLHLRFGPVARGGLRWSDRAQDYRTEVLGLVKAQQVKNAVIVPVGSKGGFVPKRLPPRAENPDAWFEAGREAYKIFISSLLSLTDNLVDGEVVPPDNVVRHDGNDPYFVVAADKGTASFSDTANAISQARDFWLDDAFASGGSAGYDHKAMGITARGAWEAVKRHFREMESPSGEPSWDIQKEPFTAAGVGDMSGDVFGNGMLLSDQTKLIAAFDHRDIFIDPDPDPQTSFEERKRLFEMGRSSWQDYDTKLISKGGGVFSRASKTIKLSQAAAEAIGFEAGDHPPQDVLSAVLKAPVDLMWFGGIGTYIKAGFESDSEVGDRANDAIRVMAKDVEAKVVGEGANLGVTQPGRIAFALNGGRINSDAIDNSAGVNSSDVEVNIKIALAAAMKSGSLTRKRRNTLLESMTETVADLVLANNYRQTLAISRTQRRGLDALAEQQRLMQALERRDLLDRPVEDLPDDAALAERRDAGQPLTRPEIGVLLAYAKIVALDDVLATDAPDDPMMEELLYGYFPPKMHKTYAEQIENHRLRREIIGTVLVNAMINHGGPTFINQAMERTGAGIDTLARAYLTAWKAFGLQDLSDAIDALDAKISGEAQLELYTLIRDCVVAKTVWFARNGDYSDGIAPVAESYAKAIKTLQPKLDKLAPGFLVERMQRETASYEENGVPQELARHLGQMPVLALLPDIELAARTADAKLEDTAKAFFAITKTFQIGRIVQASRDIALTDYYDSLALDRAMRALHRARREITVDIMRNSKDAETWLEENKAAAEQTISQLRPIVEGGTASVSRLTVAANALADLARD